MRGGDIRRIVIHLSCLDSNQIIELYEYLANQHPGIGGRIIKIQSMYRGFITRKHIEDEKKLHAAPAAANDDGITFGMMACESGSFFGRLIALPPTSAPPTSAPLTLAPPTLAP